MKTLIIVLSLLSLNALSATVATRTVASIRVEHARELMGASYKKSVVSKLEDKKVEKTIYEIVKTRLPKKFKYKAYSVAHSIITESAKHSLDPYFVMAVISGESSFNPEARGPVGEIGLMQLRPTTGEWIAKRNKLVWKGENSLKDPIFNIKLGVSYLGWLRSKFSGQGQLYVAAYNMGAQSVRNAVSKNVYPKDYPRHVMKRYIAFYKDLNKTL